MKGNLIYCNHVISPALIVTLHVSVSPSLRARSVAAAAQCQFHVTNMSESTFTASGE